jgi:hypothetical protein
MVLEWAEMWPWVPAVLETKKDCTGEDHKEIDYVLIYKVSGENKIKINFR